VEQLRKGLQPVKKDDLVLPTDAAALLFGLFIFSVAIFWANRGFWTIRTRIGISQPGDGRWPSASFPRNDIFSHTAAGQPWVSSKEQLYPITSSARA
jgi:hypothetical protein